MELLEGASERAGRRKKNCKSQRFSVRFSFLESLFVYRGEVHVDISRGPGEVVSYANSGRAFGSCFDGCRRGDPRTGPQTKIKNDGTRARSGAGRNLSFTYFVSKASVVVEGRRSE